MKMYLNYTLKFKITISKERGSSGECQADKGSKNAPRTPYENGATTDLVCRRVSGQPSRWVVGQVEGE
jgi:hypothetical protein